MEEWINGRQICRCQCHPDFSWIDWGDPTNTYFSCSDSDALFMSERCDKLLFLEWKHPGETVFEGQLRLLKRLAKIPDATTLVVYGMDGQPTLLRRARPWGLGEMENIDRDTFQRRLQNWYRQSSQSRNGH